MSETGYHDFTINQGATWNRTLTIKDDGTARNLAGYTARMTVRDTIDARDTLFELTTENGRITITPSSGVVLLALTAVETAALSWLHGVYDLELVHGATVDRILEGTIDVRPEVTV